MQIIIPMTGYGSRFVAAGYKELKPFIKVGKHKILEWIVKGMYPEEENIIFICRKEHLDNPEIQMEEQIKKMCPTARIIAIDDWVKKGPVYDVLRVSDEICDEEPCIINYCDFYMSWNYKKFSADVLRNQCDGAVPCYTGFHPHLLPEKNLYASCLVDDEDYLIEIKEKYSFEKDKTKTKHSPGTYYFKDGKTMKQYLQKLVESGDSINGEYYASMPYQFMVEDGLKVWIPTEVDYFCQWGTPEDMQEYEWWTRMIRGIR